MLLKCLARKFASTFFFSRYHDNPSTNFQVHLMCFVTNYSNNLHVGSGCYVANFSINFQVRSGCYVAEKLRSQQFVISKPRFTALLRILAMEVHQPPCQLAQEDGRKFESHLLTKKVCFGPAPKSSDENRLPQS